MKIFADTSVWINYLSGYQTERTQSLSDILDSGQPIYVLPVVIQEILQGFKHEKDVSKHIDKLDGLNALPFELQDAIEAAKLYRALRKRGITPTTIDLQIAAACIRYGLHLLTEDKGLALIAEHFDFALV